MIQRSLEINLGVKIMQGNGWKRRLIAFALCIVLTAVSFAAFSEGETTAPEVEETTAPEAEATAAPEAEETPAPEVKETPAPEEECAHEWEAGEVFEPTCETEGCRIYTCSKCGAVDRRDVTPALGHTWEATTIHEPTCETIGYTEYTCKVCGGTKADDEVLPLGHEWGEWIEEEKPTCTTSGRETRECARCKKIETNVLPPRHNWQEDGTCKDCGKSVAASIGDVKYASLQEAVDAVKEGEVIVLLADGACELKEGQTVRISKGEFALDITVPKGCILTQTDDVYTVIKAFAETDGQYYGTLAEAVAAAQPDGVVNLLADEIGGGIVIDKNLTIDFGGFTYTAKNPGGPKENPEDPSTGAAFELMPGTQVELKNGTIKGSGNAKYIIQDNSDKLTLTDMTLNALLNANLKFALSINRGETVLSGATSISGGVGQWAIDLWMTEEEDERVLVTLDEKMTGTVAGYVRIYPGSELAIVGKGYRLVKKGDDEASGCPYYCIAIVITPTQSPKPTASPTPKPTATPTPTPTATPTPKPTGSGGGGGGGSSSGSSESTTTEEESVAEEEAVEVEVRGIVDYSLDMLHSMAGFLSGGKFEN